MAQIQQNSSHKDKRITAKQHKRIKGKKNFPRKTEGKGAVTVKNTIQLWASRWERLKGRPSF